MNLIASAVLRFLGVQPQSHVSLTPDLITLAQGVTLDACEALNEARRARGEPAVLCGDEPSWERLSGVEWRRAGE